jgi:hypothetical protein
MTARGGNLTEKEKPNGHEEVREATEKGKEDRTDENAERDF